jgi:hypothetical protein
VPILGVIAGEQEWDLGLNTVETSRTLEFECAATLVGAAVGDPRCARDADHLRSAQEVWCRRSMRVGREGGVSPMKSPDSLNA